MTVCKAESSPLTKSVPELVNNFVLIHNNQVQELPLNYMQIYIG